MIVTTTVVEVVTSKMEVVEYDVRRSTQSLWSVYGGCDRESAQHNNLPSLNLLSIHFTEHKHAVRPSHHDYQHFTGSRDSRRLGKHPWLHHTFLLLLFDPSSLLRICVPCVPNAWCSVLSLSDSVRFSARSHFFSYECTVRIHVTEYSSTKIISHFSSFAV